MMRLSDIQKVAEMSKLAACWSCWPYCQVS